MKGKQPSNAVPLVTHRQRGRAAVHGLTPPKAADTIEVFLGGSSAARLSTDAVLVAPVDREHRRHIASQLRLLIYALENR